MDAQSVFVGLVIGAFGGYFFSCWLAYRDWQDMVRRMTGR